MNELRRTLREVLDIIDDVLQKGGMEAMELSNVLTALRGPDSNDPDLKAATTCVIRTFALPRTAARASAYQYPSSWPPFAAGMQFAPPELQKVTLATRPLGDHFAQHIYVACRHLNIPVVYLDELTKEEK